MDIQKAINRNPSDDNNPLDRASFYVEELKYGPGEGQLEVASELEMIQELEMLLREAKIESMTGKELLEATAYYGMTTSRSMGLPFQPVWSIFMDGLMHGIAFAAGIEGSHRGSK